MTDYEAYIENPDEYDYELRKKNIKVSKEWIGMEQYDAKKLNEAEIQEKIEEKIEANMQKDDNAEENR